MKKINRESRGFTLMELLVVIGIIGILATIVLVSLSTARDKGRDVRVLSSIRQIRTLLEINYLTGAYADLNAGVNNVASVGTGPAAADLVQLINDIGSQNGNINAVTIAGNNVDLFSDGSSVQIGPGLGNDTGVTIFTSNTTGLATDYAIYATTSAGYVCTDSSGHVRRDGVGTITDVPKDASGKVICQ